MTNQIIIRNPEMKAYIEEMHKIYKLCDEIMQSPVIRTYDISQQSWKKNLKVLRYQNFEIIQTKGGRCPTWKLIDTNTNQVLIEAEMYSIGEKIYHTVNK